MHFSPIHAAFGPCRISRSLGLRVSKVTNPPGDGFAGRARCGHHVGLFVEQVVHVRQFRNRAVGVRRVTVQVRNVLRLVRRIGHADGARADRAARHRAITAAIVLAQHRRNATRILAGRVPVRAVVRAAVAGCHAAADAARMRVVARRVLDIAIRERARRKRVLRRVRIACDNRPLKIRVPLHTDIESTVTRLDAGLFIHPCIAAARIRVRVAETRAAAALADGESAARAVLVRVGCHGVLNAGDVQVAANIRVDLPAVDIRPDDIGIAARNDGGGIRRRHMGVVLRGGIAAAVAVRFRHRRIDTPALRAVGDTDARATGFTGAAR